MVKSRVEFLVFYAEKFLGRLNASDAVNAYGLAHERWPQYDDFRIVRG